jgi:SprB repeat
MKMKKLFFTIAIVLAVFVSCSKPEADDELSFVNDLTLNDQSVFFSTAKSAVLTSDEFPVKEELCNLVKFDFIAGQSIDAGDVFVGNDKDSLYIEITSTEGFKDDDGNIKMWIGATMPFTSRPPTGQFPFQYRVEKGDTVIYLSFTLAELGLKCDAPAFYIIIHGDVLAPSAETAFAGNIEGPGTGWWFYLTYAPECCEPPEECEISAKASVTNVKCFGALTGEIDITVSDGTAPYVYLWNTGAVSEDLDGIPAGTYSVTVTDANECVATVAGIVVLQPESAISASGEVTGISVFGAADGAIDVTVSGGTAPYAFLWNNDATSEDLEELGPGIYSVVITDANGCSTTLRELLVQEPDEEKPEGLVAFARKTYTQMVHSFSSLDMNDDGIMDFDEWGWTNGAISENETFISKYELFINTGQNNEAEGTKVGDMAIHYFGGTATATIKLLPGFTMSETALYIGNEMLPEAGGVYTIDPADYPYIHVGLGEATSDTFTVSASGSVYVIGYALILPESSEE